MAVDLSFFRSETSQRLREEGRVAGRVAGRVEDILVLLEKRGVAVPGDARERILTCQDITTLDTWFTRAITATTTEDVLAGDDDSHPPA